MPAGEPTESSWWRAIPRALRTLAPIGLIVLLVAGAILRLALSFSYEPAQINFVDAIPYIGMAQFELFSDPARTAGYSIFLEGMHTLSANVSLLIAVQHLLGLATGCLVYATTRRAGAPVWAGLIGAAVVLLSLDQISVEHTISSESVFTFLFVGAAYAAMRSLDEGRVLRGPLTTQHAWLLGAGALLGLSATVRAVGGLLVPFLALWAALAIRQRWPLRIATGAIAIVPAVAILLTYFAFNQSHTGSFGLTQAGGWSLYSRVAQFADCSEFTPPEGTEELCETTPPEERPGPDFYTWQEGSPARDLFGPPPAGNELLGEFGREALLAQPVDYARAALTDLGRYFVPSLGLPRPYSGTDYSYLNIDRRETAPIEEEIVRWISGYFDPISPDISGLALTLSDMQQVMRVHPILLLQAVLLGIAGFVFARGRVRAAIALLTGAGFLLIALAAATGTVHPRYTIPAGGPLAAGAALSLWVLLGRYVERARAVP